MKRLLPDITIDETRPIKLVPLALVQQGATVSVLAIMGIPILECVHSQDTVLPYFDNTVSTEIAAHAESSGTWSNQ